MDSIPSSQSRSAFEVSSRQSRITKEAKSKAAAHIQEQRAQQQQHDQSRPIVRDPDTDKECIPLPIIDKVNRGGKIGIKKPGGSNSRSDQHQVSQTSGDSRDRRQSLPSFNESSTGQSQSNERSISRADKSSNSGSDQISGISEDTGGLWGDDSSDSHSTHERSSDQSSFFRGGTHHTTSHMSSESYGQDSRQGGVGGGGGGRRSDQPLLKDFIVRPRPTKEFTPEEFRAWRQDEVILTLTETPVMMLFSRNDELVPNDDSPETLLVKKNNERYANYCASRKDGESGGRYTSTAVTTLNDPYVSENHQFEPPEKPDSGPIQVTTWKLHDALEKTAAQLAAANAEEAGIGAGGIDADTSGVVGDGGEEGGAGAGGDDGDNDVDGEGEGGGEGSGGEGGQQQQGQSNPQAAQERKKNAWKRSSTIAESLMIVERCVVQTIFDELQVLYRGLPYDEKLIDVNPIPPPQTAGGHSSGSGNNNNTTTNNTNLGQTVTTSSKQQQQGLDVTKRDNLDVTKIAGGGGAGRLGETQAGVGGQTMANLFSTAAGGGFGGNNTLIRTLGGTVSGASQPREKMKVLWRYSEPELTANHTVSCMSSNRINPDIIAAGYNANNASGTGIIGGKSVICCWSLKNPTAPERTIIPPNDAAITSMHFGKQNGSLLAVGSTDGMISLYDVRKHGNAPALKSTVNTGQHTGTVWETRWVEKGQNRDEALISISADGFVKEWSIKKGLERVGDLIRLKRGVSRDKETAGASYGGSKGKTREALLSRQSGGMCFDMNPNDPMIYVVGTEDGTIAKCTKSKDDNTIFDYSAHDEPVYRIRWSPFNSNYFVSCSADWTSRLYHIDKHDPLMIFDSNRQDPVQDLAWSPHCSTLFANCTSGGRVELWDLSDPHQAKAVFEMSDRSLTSLLFAEQESPVVLTGDNKGEVTVLKLNGIEFERNMMSEQEQEHKIRDVVRKQQIV